MKKIIALLIAVLIILAGTIAVLAVNLSNENPTGSAVSREYSYTKAICDDKNFCQDYVIACSGKELISQTPIDNAVIQNSLAWKDPRSPEAINMLCG